MSARKAMLLAKRSNEFLSESIIKIESHPCFAHIDNATTEKWKFEERHYHITGGKRDNSFKECYHLAKQLVSNVIHKPDEIKSRQIYAMSYYYDRAVDAKLIKDEEKMGVVKVGDYFKTAEKVCNSATRSHEQSAFLCLDLTYISALLHDGLRLDWQREITVC